MAVAAVSDLLTPMEMVEKLAITRQWEIDRCHEDEIVVFVVGRYSKYEVAFSWLEDLQALHISCAFDFLITKDRSAEAHELIRLLNDKLWVGHFTWLSDEKVALLRHAIVRPPDGTISQEQIYVLMAKVLDGCEEHYASFDFLTEGKTVRDALELNIGATMGRA